MNPIVDISLTTSFYNAIFPSGQQLNVAVSPQGEVSGYWLEWEPAQSLLSSGHEVKAEERKRGEGARRCHKISILNFCSYVLRVDGNKSLQQREEGGGCFRKDLMWKETYVKVYTSAHIYQAKTICWLYSVFLFIDGKKRKHLSQL